MYYTSIFGGYARVSAIQFVSGALHLRWKMDGTFEACPARRFCSCMVFVSTLINGQSVVGPSHDCWIVVGLSLISGWSLGDFWLDRCSFMAGLSFIYDWILVHLWLDCRSFMGFMTGILLLYCRWYILEWCLFMAGLLLIYGEGARAMIAGINW